MAADGDAPAYALLAAGSGTRMGPLTSDRAKVLVEVAGRTILDHNLRAIAAVAPGARVAVIAGYRADTVAEAVAAQDHGLAAEVLVNADFARSGPLRSLALALDRFADGGGALTIGNGDTIFEPPALTALAGSAAPAALLMSAPDDPDPDDVQVRIEDGHVRAAAKRLAPPGDLPVSAGLLRIGTPAMRATVAGLVRALIAEEDRTGRNLTWHSLLAALAAGGHPAAPEPVAPDWWCEFDSSACIDRYLARRARPISG